MLWSILNYFNLTEIEEKFSQIVYRASSKLCKPLSRQVKSREKKKKLAGNAIFEQHNVCKLLVYES